MRALYATMNQPMRIILVLLSVLNLSSCVTSAVLIGCGATAVSMPSNEPVKFSASLNVTTATGVVVDSVAYTCEVKERKCLGGDWRIVWEEQNIPAFNVKLSENYHASITSPSCRVSSDMAKSDSYGYTEIITVYDSTTNEQVYRATANNTDLQEYDFVSLSVKVE
jgi:hypothetical protein